MYAKEGAAQRPNGSAGGGRKRPLEEFSNGHYKPRKQKVVCGPVLPKNALMQLNEIKPGLRYQLLAQTGPVHAPIFLMAVQVNGRLYEGSGPTKKKARLSAAENALRSLVQVPNASEAHMELGRTLAVHTDFTSDQADFPGLLFNGFEVPGSVEGPHTLASRSSSLRFLEYPLRSSPVPDLVQAPLPAAPHTSTCSTGSKNPIMILNELRPGLKYDFVSESGESHAKTFVVSVMVDAQLFQGSGRNKRLAKTRAARAALSSRFHMQLDHDPSRRPRPRAGLQLHLPQVNMKCYGAATGPWPPSTIFS